jgi:hypothetical protein
MKIGLESDFRDFYDHWFDKAPVDYLLRRNTRPNDGISKRDQFELLENAGFSVPIHGWVHDIWSRTSKDYLVVYDDEFAHCGEGKTLWHRTKAAMEATGKYCSIFIPTTNDPVTQSESIRLLAIGDRLFWLTYKSDGWMSNHAENIEVKVNSETLGRRSFAIEGEHDFDFLNRYPLFAIDFVKPLSSNLIMAIDFNTSPGLKGTGIEDVLPAKEVHKLIADFVVIHQLQRSKEF